VAEHAGGVEIEARVMGEEIPGDLAASGVRGGLQWSFKITATQSQHALTSSGVSSMRARTAARSRWDWPTAAWTFSGGSAGGFGGALDTPGAGGAVSCAEALRGSRPVAMRPAVVRRKWRRVGMVGGLFFNLGLLGPAVAEAMAGRWTWIRGWESG
jgi:hypothetical protein